MLTIIFYCFLKDSEKTPEFGNGFVERDLNSDPTQVRESVHST